MALAKSLTTLRGAGLMLNIVIGAGLLALPGLVVQQVGRDALWAWGLCALTALPLLLVFVIMGRRFPDAGGIAHFARTAFGPPAYAVASLIFLGAVAFGLPAIALTGGHYLAEAFGGPPAAYAALLVMAAATAHLLSTDMAGRISTAIASLVLLSLVGLIVIGFYAIGAAPPAGPMVTPLIDLDLHRVLMPFMMIFFAFTGWELAAGLSEEFRNPARDFPRAMALSFAAACLIYGCMAFVVQNVPITGTHEAAFASLMAFAFGEQGRLLMALLATAIIFANLMGAIWAVSRMVFSLSREGLLPLDLSTNRHGAPLSAVALTSGVVLLVLCFDAAGLLRVSDMLALAGQNFLLLYGLSGLALTKLAHRPFDRAVALVTVAIVIALVIAQGTTVIYPLALALLGIITERLRRSVRRPGVPEPD